MPARDESSGQSWTFVLTGLAVVYFGFFGLIVLDELVFKTYHISGFMPYSIGEYIHKIYWPLIKIVEMFT